MNTPLIDSLVQQDPHLFKKLHHQKILITGGSGFFGRWVLSVLKAAMDYYTLEAEIFVLSRSENFLNFKKPDWLIPLQGDIKVFNFLKLPQKIDFILHMAGSSNPRDYQVDPTGMFNNLVLGAERVKHYAKQAQPQKILFTSSGAVYGKKNRVDQKIRENLQPDLLGADIYSRAKYQAEQVFLNSALPIVIARCFAFYGETQPVGHGFAIADMKAEFEKTGRIDIKNPRTVRSFMHMGDLVRALFYLLLQPSPLGIFNIGGAEEENIMQTAVRLAGMNEQAVTAGKIGSPNYYVPDVQKLREIGFIEKFSSV